TRPGAGERDLQGHLHRATTSLSDLSRRRPPQDRCHRCQPSVDAAPAFRQRPSTRPVPESDDIDGDSIMTNRNLLAVLALAAAAVAGQASAGDDDPQNVRTVTAAEAANLPDDTRVRVEGRIVRSLGDEEYEFRDDTGTMRVEIDDDDWDGQ